MDDRLCTVDYSRDASGFTPHTHSTYEILYLVRGEAEVRFGGAAVTAKAPAAVLVNCLEEHATHILSGEYERYTFKLSAAGPPPPGRRPSAADAGADQRRAARAGPPLCGAGADFGAGRALLREQILSHPPVPRVDGLHAETVPAAEPDLLREGAAAADEPHGLADCGKVRLFGCHGLYPRLPAGDGPHAERRPQGVRPGKKVYRFAFISLSAPRSPV